MKFSFLLLLFCASAWADPGHWQGKQRAVVLLVEWRNQPARHTVREVRDVFFGEGNKSLSDFFRENSVGRFELTGDVRQWQHSNHDWSNAQGCDLDSIVAEAWHLFSRAIRVSDYDTDGNGRIDNLFIIHSGRIDSDRVGPDCAFTQNAVADHTVVFQSEGLGSIGSAIPIGFYLHEAGHGYFGLPDLYGDHYHGRYGIGMWGIMGLGAWGTSNTISNAALFRYPAHFEPYSKASIGWNTPRVIRESTHLVLRPVETAGDVIAIPVDHDTSLYLEYRSERGFSAGHRGHGLLVWRNLDFIQADGRDDLNNGRDLGHRPLPPNDENFGDDSDPFPGSGGVTSYEDREGHVRLENITQYGDRIELDVRTLPGYQALDWVRPRGVPLDFTEML